MNDTIDRACLEALAKQGVRLVALRCAGFNQVDLRAAAELGIRIARVPAYSPHAVAEHAVALLLTLNRWDGCCIGLPPTPFDAIDVTMRTPQPLEGAHLIRFGTFRGRLSVSVFEIGGFLLGLYRLEDTTFETK